MRAEGHVTCDEHWAVHGPGPNGFTWVPSDVRDRDVNNAWGARVPGLLRRVPPPQRWRPILRVGDTLCRLMDGVDLATVSGSSPVWKFVRFTNI